MLAAHKM